MVDVVPINAKKYKQNELVTKIQKNRGIEVTEDIGSALILPRDSIEQHDMGVGGECHF